MAPTVLLFRICFKYRKVMPLRYEPIISKAIKNISCRFVTLRYYSSYLPCNDRNVDSTISDQRILGARECIGISQVDFAGTVGKDQGHSQGCSTYVGTKWPQLIYHLLVSVEHPFVRSSLTLMHWIKPYCENFTYFRETKVNYQP